MSVVLNDEDAETIMNALLHAHHELSFFYALRVNDVPDVKFNFDSDCFQADKLVCEAISILLIEVHEGGDYHD